MQSGSTSLMVANRSPSIFQQTACRSVQTLHKLDHSNIFSEAFHELPNYQRKNPELKQEFHIGENRSEWIDHVVEKKLPPLKVYDCLRDITEVIPREPYIAKEKSLVSQNYTTELQDSSAKFMFRQQSGPFMKYSDVIERNNHLIISSRGKSVEYNKDDQTKRDKQSQVSDKKTFTVMDVSHSEQTESRMNSRPSRLISPPSSRYSQLRGSLISQQTNFFSQKRSTDEKEEDSKRDQYLSHNPKYCNEVEHSMNKEFIEKGIRKEKMIPQTSQLARSSQLYGGKTGNSDQKYIMNNSKALEISHKGKSSLTGLESINEISRSALFQQFDDELSKFEKSLGFKKKSSVWLKGHSEHQRYQQPDHNFASERWRGASPTIDEEDHKFSKKYEFKFIPKYKSTEEKMDKFLLDSRDETDENKESI